jgi:hypothetical protein
VGLGGVLSKSRAGPSESCSGLVGSRVGPERVLGESQWGPGQVPRSPAHIRVGIVQVQSDLRQVPRGSWASFGGVPDRSRVGLGVTPPEINLG